MVFAEDKQISALINAIKGLPVECKNFDVADTWVGIVIELERIKENKYEEPIEAKSTPTDVESPKPVEIRYAPPENIIKGE